MLSGLMGLDFCCHFQMLGSAFGIKNTKSMDSSPDGYFQYNAPCRKVQFNFGMWWTGRLTSKVYLIKWPASACQALKNVLHLNKKRKVTHKTNTDSVYYMVTFEILPVRKSF